MPPMATPNQNDAGISERLDFVNSVLEEVFGYIVW